VDVQGTNGFIGGFLARKLQAEPQARLPAPAPALDKKRETTTQDTVSFSPSTQDGQTGQRQLLQEREEETQGGVRIVQDFVTGEGRPFTRIQEFSQTPRGFQRDVVQQNPSGSTTRLQEVLDRQENGLFRRTLRFTDINGVEQTRIESDFISTDPFVLSEGQDASGANSYVPNPFDPTRGTRLDVSA
jgi:hypothetical protein